jgi:hypothetical protein
MCFKELRPLSKKVMLTIGIRAMIFIELGIAHVNV